jgi:8-oxo-dGTP diphosphatase
MRRVQAASTIVLRDDGALLLIRRGRPPLAGLWSVPGGKAEGSETLRQTAARETFEETGLHVDVGEHFWQLDIPVSDELVYEVHDFAATVTGGRLQAGDDAAEVRWVPVDQLARLSLVDHLLEHLRAGGIVPRPDHLGAGE